MATKKSSNKSNKKTRIPNTSQVKVKARRPKYKDAMKDSYAIGYARGWEDAYELPKRVGAKTFAAMGYKKGARNRVRSDKYVSKYQKRG